jgi:hypothetical protein
LSQVPGSPYKEAKIADILLVQLGLGLKEIRSVAILIDRYVGDIAAATLAETPVVLCGDHPVHDDRLKRTQRQSYVALVLSNIRRSPS